MMRKAQVFVDADAFFREERGTSGNFHGEKGFFQEKTMRAAPSGKERMRPESRIFWKKPCFFSSSVLWERCRGRRRAKKLPGRFLGRVAAGRQGMKARGRREIPGVHRQGEAYAKLLARPGSTACVLPEK